MDNKIKYIILDFGKVLACSSTGHWFITPNFWNDINKEEIDENKLLNNFKKYNYILDKKVITLDEEYEMFYEFYKLVLKEFNIDNNIVKKITNDIVYHDDKYRFYDDVKEELTLLKEKYKLILLSDNWPCVLRIMKNYEIDNFFEKIYVSSIYGEKKEDGLFFDYPIKDFNIKKGEAIFIDDNEALLDVAITKGLIVRHMDRENEVLTSNYKIIHDLSNII